jgi:hypothetical protein
MMLRVRELGDEVHIDVDGVAGRQHRVLLALAECQRRTLGRGVVGSTQDSVNVRAGANNMRIRMKSRDGLRFEASTVYQCLREVLLDRGAPAGVGTPAP